METKEILSHIDHTQLKPYATLEDIYKLCDEAVTYGTASVCIHRVMSGEYTIDTAAS